MDERGEAFCREFVANGGIATLAFLHAFPLTNHGKPRKHGAVKVQAAQLAKNPEIIARIAEIRAEAAARSDNTIDGLNTQLDEAYDIAKERKDAKAMVQATMGKAKLNGLLVEKTENKHTHEIAPGMAREILANLAKKHLGE